MRGGVQSSEILYMTAAGVVVVHDYDDGSDAIFGTKNWQRESLDRLCRVMYVTIYISFGCHND